MSHVVFVAVTLASLAPLHAQFVAQPGARQLLEAMGFEEEVSTACLCSGWALPLPPSCCVAPQLLQAGALPLPPSCCRQRAVR